MTLPELLVTITVVGLIMTVLASAIVVTIRQERSTAGRFNVARAEQVIGLWLPGDLASASAVSPAEGATDWNPCGHIEVEGAWVDTGDTCPDLGLPAGSNALMIGWSIKDENDHVTYTNVMYHFSQAADGSFQLARIECVNDGAGWECSHMILLHDLPGPPPGTPWEPGVTVPDWVIRVSRPLTPTGTDEGDIVIGDSGNKNSKRVIVTIDGGGTSAGAGGGSNQISITAGGTNRNVIDGTSLQGAPSFAEALSLCGGPMTLLVDESNSIGDVAGALTNVKNGVRQFVTALIGTPVKLQVIGFHTYSHVLGTSEWHKYYDMTNESDVATLLAAINTLQDSWSSGTNNPPFSGQNGGTNWEEALFRTFYAPDGTTTDPVPDTVVFFTDGVPTFDRLVRRTSPGVLPAQPPAASVPPWSTSTGSAYNQVAFNRADFIAQQFRGPVDLIGVGIGSAATGTTTFTRNPGAGYHLVWERGYRQYQRMTFQSNIDFEKAATFSANLDYEKATPQSRLDFEHGSTYQSRIDFERATTFQSQRDFEQRVGNAWQDRTPSQYYASNTTPGESDGWRIGNASDTGTRAWYAVTEAEYDAYSSQSPNDWRIPSNGWTDTTAGDYYTNQPAKPNKYRIGTSTSWRNQSEADFDSYRAQSPNNWQVSAWANTSPTDYYTNQPTRPLKYRLGTETTWRNVTETEYADYSAASPTNWQLAWGDITPSDYYPNAANTARYRINTPSNRSNANGNTGRWFSVTEAEYIAYSTASPANWRIDTWADTTPTLYYTNQPANPAIYRINTPSNRGTSSNRWFEVTWDEYKAHNTTANETDGWRVNTSNPTWISKAEYDANNVSAGSADGWHDTGSPQYVSAADAKDWVVWTASRNGISSNQFRSHKEYGPPFDEFEPADVEPNVANWKIIGRLVAGSDQATELASPEGGPYTNVATANLYKSANWSQLPVALTAIALGECGGTLTLQTRLNGAPANDPFTYQNSKQYDSNGNELTIEPKVVRTNRQFTTGNFDFKIESGLYRDVVILPENLSDLGAYEPAGWTCRAGANARAFTLVDIPGFESSPWKGIRVRVAANEAVSCIQSVTR